MTEYDIANRAITEGNYNAAIATMAQKVDYDANDKKARLILASAYAARAGVYMRDYIEISQKVVDKIREAEAYLSSDNLQIFERIKRGMSNQDQIKMVDAVQKTYSALYQANQIINIFSSIPTLSLAAQKDLSFAVQILSAEKNYINGAALYRGVLRLVLFKNHMKTDYKLSHLNKCSMNITSWISELQEIKDDASNILYDFSLGTNSPKLRQEISDISQSLDFDFNKAIRVLQNLNLEHADVSHVTKAISGQCEKWETY